MNDEFDEYDLGALVTPPEPDYENTPEPEAVFPKQDTVDNDKEQQDSVISDTSISEEYIEDTTAEAWTEEDGIAEDEKLYGNSEYHSTANSSSETVTINQDAAIAAAEASEKKNLKRLNHDNKANFLNRSRLILVIAFAAVIFIVFFALFAPQLKVKKKKEKTETSKAGKTYIPSEIQNFKPEEKDTVPDFTDGNSSIQDKDSPKDSTSFDEKFPPIVNNEKENVAPIAVPQKTGSSTSDFPITNRNEQQKPLQRLAMEKYSSPTETQKTKGNSYGYTGPQGYNSSYGSSGSNSPTQTYTPYSLSNNMEKYMGRYGQNESSYNSQNNQTQKNEFLNKNGIGGNFQWNSDFSLWKGTIISAVLDTGINTDLPGSVMGHVTKNIYSSQDGRYLLIPQGSRLYGEYNSDISYGQKRVQVVWNTLIRPDGLEINLGNMNGIDSKGASGYRGFKTDHPFEYAKAFGLIAMYSILDTKVNNLLSETENNYVENVMTDVYSETKRLNNKIVDRALDIQPTNTIKSGTEVQLITNVTIDIPPLESYNVTEKYVRQ